MMEHIKNNVQLQILGFFIAMPLMIWAVGNYPQRTLLKDSLSVTTILAFSLMIGLFYLARTNRAAVKKIGLLKLLGWHKIIGYLAVPVLLTHPFLLVLPRFYEAGIAPGEAFNTIVTTFSSPGILFGLSGWCLLLILGVTSLLRKKLPLSYRSWRILHGALALLCITSAAFHVVDLGRHTDIAMTTFISLLSAGGIYLLLKSYVPQNQSESAKR